MNNNFPVQINEFDNLMVVSGPSGTGKSTLIRLLLKKNRELVFCVSHTTRPRRKNETEGSDYYFVTEEQFVAMIQENRFVEWARVYSHYYGTSREEILSKGRERTVVLDIDVQGARNMKKICPRAWFVFVVPPSIAELKKRLSGRHRGETRSEIEERLSRAEAELAEYRLYDFIVLNDRKERALFFLDCIYQAFNHRQVRKINELFKIMGENK